MFGRRPDGTLVRDAAPIRRFMPFISPRRNDSLVLFSQELVVEDALRFADERNASRPDYAPMTLFHLILRAIAMAIDERPRLNRFVAGGRLWQRDGIWMTFSAKKTLSDEGALTTPLVAHAPDGRCFFMTLLVWASARRGAAPCASARCSSSRPSRHA